ncbi:transposase domain-containing protein [Streptomyces cadmiisoli]|uniref:transposase domain-containing protein n=1 Tax=Streptomyces cadmiisoli TaxID=2184053 RepID=UPI003D71F7FD
MGDLLSNGISASKFWNFGANSARTPPESLTGDLTSAVQRQVRDLPSRVGVYFLLALRLFPEVDYRLIRDKLTAGLSGMPVVYPSAKALQTLTPTPVNASTRDIPLDTKPGAIGGVGCGAPRQVTGMFPGFGNMMTRGSDRPVWTSAGRFQASAPWGRWIVLYSSR